MRLPFPALLVIAASCGTPLAPPVDVCLGGEPSGDIDLPLAFRPLVLAGEPAEVSIGSPVLDCGVPSESRWVRIQAEDELGRPVTVTADPLEVVSGATRTTLRWAGGPAGDYLVTVWFEPAMGLVQVPLTVVPGATGAITLPAVDCPGSLVRLASGTLLCQSRSGPARVFRDGQPVQTLGDGGEEWVPTGPVLWGIGRSSRGATLSRYVEGDGGFTLTASAQVFGAAPRPGEASSDALPWRESVYRFTGTPQLAADTLDQGFSDEWLLIQEPGGPVRRLQQQELCTVGSSPPGCLRIGLPAAGLSSHVLVTARTHGLAAQIETRGRPVGAVTRRQQLLDVELESFPTMRANRVPFLRRADGRLAVFTGSGGADWLVALPAGAIILGSSDDGVVYRDDAGLNYLPVGD